MIEIVVHVVAGACIAAPALIDCWIQGVPLSAVYNIESLRHLVLWK